MVATYKSITTALQATISLYDAANSQFLAQYVDDGQIF